MSRTKSEAHVTGASPHRRAGRPWSYDDDVELRHLAARGLPLKEIASLLERHPCELRVRLGLPDGCGAHR